jgi:hypothetical protein
MHTVEKIASILSQIPQKPNQIPFEFFAIPFSKYITIFNDGTTPSNYYPYIEDVIDDISKTLNSQGIKIVQICSNPNQPQYFNTYYINNFTLSQLNFLIKNSLFHISTDNYSNELAGILDIPSLSIAGNRHTSNSLPWFGSSSLAIGPNDGIKPCFSQTDPMNRMANVKPEQVSYHVLKHFDLNSKIEYKTLFLGSRYPSINMDYIPNFKLNNDSYGGFNVNVRLDKSQNLQNCYDFCSKFKHRLTCSTSTDKNFIKLVQKNINQLIYIVDKNSNPDDFNEFSGFGIPVFYVSYDVTNQNLVKLNFIDKGVKIINLYDNRKKIEELCGTSDFGLSFKSSKIILSNNTKYISYAHVENDIKADRINKPIFSKEFFKDIDCYKIYRKII